MSTSASLSAIFLLLVACSVYSLPSPDSLSGLIGTAGPTSIPAIGIPSASNNLPANNGIPSLNNLPSVDSLPSTKNLPSINTLPNLNNLPSLSGLPSLQGRNEPNNHPSGDEWSCDPNTKQDTVCVDMSQSSTPPWISPSQTFPGFNSCIDACWYDAYHVKARHRIQYKGENSTSTAMVAGRYTIYSNSHYYQTETHREGIWRSANRDQDGQWLYTKYKYDGPDNDLKLKFDEFTASSDFVEVRGEWIDWKCPFDKRSPIEGLEPFGILAGSDIGYSETGTGIMVNPFYEG